MKKSFYSRLHPLKFWKKGVESSKSKQKDLIIELIFTIIIALMIIFFMVLLT